MKSSADFADFEKRHKHSKDFSHEMYQDMKQKAQKSKTIREEIDPEIEEAFKKLNMNKMYREFMARPMFSSPEELHEQVMQPAILTKMSKRDKARMKFVADHRKNRMIQSSFKNRAIVIAETLQDIDEGPEALKLKQLSYK